MSAVLAAFGTGLLASLSPCVYPLLPITLGFLGTQAGADGAAAGRSRLRALTVLSYAFGQIFAFVALGALAVAAGETLGFTSESRAANAFMGILLVGAGGVSLAGRLPRLPGPLERAARAGGERLRRGSAPNAGAAGAFALGAGSVVVASPCTTPLLAGVLGMLASSATIARGLGLMAVYSIGFSSLFLLLGFGLLRLGRLPRSGRWMILLQRVGACAMAGAGFYYLAKAVF